MHTVKRNEDGTYSVGYWTDIWNGICKCDDVKQALMLVHYLNGGSSVDVLHGVQELCYDDAN